MPQFTVLIVEDEQLNRESLAILIEDAFGPDNVTVIAVPDTIDAIEVIMGKIRVDFVVSDYNLVSGNADPLVECLKKTKIHGLTFPRVVCMSGSRKPIGGFVTAVTEGATFLCKSDEHFASKIADILSVQLGVPIRSEAA